MRLSQQTKNAIAILVHFARQPDATRTVPEIAQACDITEYNVFKLVPLLTKAGFLRTIQGRKGGVRLDMPADTIAIGAVVEATEKRLAQLPAKDDRKDEQVDFESVVDDAFLAFLDILNQSTIAELAGEPRPEDAPGGAANAPATEQPSVSAK